MSSEDKSNRDLENSKQANGSIKNIQPKSKKPVLEWEIAQEATRKKPKGLDECLIFTIRIVKILYLGILFSITLGSLLLSRIILHFIVWHLNPIGEDLTNLSSLHGMVQLRANTTGPMYEGNIRIISRSWIWALFFIIIYPNFHNLWTNLVKMCSKFQKPKLWSTIMGLLIEVCHSIGMNILVFVTLPQFDPIGASLVCILTTMVPSILSILKILKCKSGFQNKVRPYDKNQHKIREEQDKGKDGDPKPNVSTSTNVESEKTERSSKESGKSSSGSKEIKSIDTDAKQRNKESQGSVKINEARSTRTDSDKSTGNNHASATEINENAKNSESRGDVYEYERLIEIIRRISFLLLLLSYAMFILYVFESIDHAVVTFVVITVLGLFLLSVYWWDCNQLVTPVVDGEFDEKKHIQEGSLCDGIYTLLRLENNTEMFLFSFVKILISLLSVFTFCTAVSDDKSKTFFVLTGQSESVNVSIFGTKYTLTAEPDHDSGCSYGDPFFLAFLSCFSGYVGLKLSQHACRILFQRLNFALPILLNIAVVPIVLYGILKSGSWRVRGCSVIQHNAVFMNGEFTEIRKLVFFAVSGYIGLICLTVHVWFSGGIKYGKKNILFSKHVQCTVFPDIHLLMMRRVDYNKAKNSSEANDRGKNSEFDPTPMIHVCATMWHESEEEMRQLLFSIFDMNKHQITKSITRGDNMYDFVAHIFFDDAFVPNFRGNKQKRGRYLNLYAERLRETIKRTWGELNNIELQSTSIKTPFGRQEEWVLENPNDKHCNKLIVYYKDKFKIRNKKRWSQIMYMRYLLEFIVTASIEKFKQLNEEVENLEKRLEDKRRAVLRNTFILTLDGDVDFKPRAVRLLLDRMKKDKNVGAACGRIHPIGSGPIAWYQKFEYAVSHWLQKATEHVSACVLCSPGCFSLFRAEAIVDDNVLTEYMRLPQGAWNHIQFDQGEDRYLCTLLLKRNIKVEYCAASDAYTYVPEGFDEFYRQRRRWAPSTMANIIDLLADWRVVTATNDHISTMFMLYQLLLLISSLLTPGTIFLLVLGAIITAFPEIEPWIALLINLIPVLIMVFSILVLSDQVQIRVAAALSVLYSLIMITVLIGLIREVVTVGYCSTTVVFFCFVAGIFVIAALIHPQEFTNILYGLVYFLAVPSASMLLIIYALGNLHVISWGTREVDKDLVTSKENKEKQRKRKKYKMADPEKGTMEDTVNEASCSIGTLFKCIFCPSPVSATSIKSVDRKPHKDAETQTETCNEDVETNILKQTKKSKVYRGQSMTTDELMEAELFWKDLIKKYLYPLDVDTKEKKRTETELRELRNSVFAGFLVINTIFVTIVYVLTQINTYKNILSFEISCPVVDETRADTILIEPIPITFTLVFGVTLIIQFFGMLYHRFSTFAQILVSTKIPNICKKNKSDHKTDTMGQVKEDIKGTSKSKLSEYIRTGKRSKPMKMSETENKDIQGRGDSVDEDNYSGDKLSIDKEIKDENEVTNDQTVEHAKVEDITHSNSGTAPKHDLSRSIRNISFLDDLSLSITIKKGRGKQTLSKTNFDSDEIKKDQAKVDEQKDSTK